MSNLYGNIAAANGDDEDKRHDNDKDLNVRRKLELDISEISGLRFEDRESDAFLQEYLSSSDGQTIGKQATNLASGSDVLFSPSSTSSQRNVVTPTLKIEHHDDDAWGNLLAPSSVDVDEFKAHSNQLQKQYLGAISTDQDINDAYKSDMDAGYASSNYQTPSLHPQDPAISPAVSYLTTGDDELDDLLSVHSGTSGYSNFSLPLSASGYKHVTNINELDNLLTAANRHFDLELNEIMQSTAQQQDSNQIQGQNSRLPPVISVQEFQEQQHTQLSSPTLGGQSFERPQQRLDSSFLCPTEAPSDVCHEDMRNGRIAKRRASHGSRTPSKVSPRSRSMSPDEKARSLSEDSDRLLELADLQPLSPNDSRNNGSGQSMSPLDDGETLQNLSGNTKKRLSQKNPATYACELCDKRFTRPYNLKSHLRTHTNERPFVCSICGKAFARQHDRKRHEDLHTGKKRYVCGGKLKDGTSWGCGKKFARSDALGRHFKTESGRKCITPLYEEASRDKDILDLNSMSI